MDTLSHLIFSLAGGYLTAYAAKMKVKAHTVPLLAVASLLIDVDHMLPHLGVTSTLLLHNIAFTALAAYIAYRFIGHDAGVLSAVMLAGHLLLDMNTGIYGIPLLYPITSQLYLIPSTWEFYVFGDPRYTIISRTGIALLLYGAFIAAASYLVWRRAR